MGPRLTWAEDLTNDAPVDSVRSKEGYADVESHRPHTHGQAHL